MPGPSFRDVRFYVGVGFLIILVPVLFRIRLDKLFTHFHLRKKARKMSSVDLEKVIQGLAGTTVSVPGEDEVSFAGRGLKLDTAEDAKEVVERLKSLPTMTTFRMEGNTVGVDAAKEIAKALEAHSHFQRAYWKDMFTGRLKEEIPQALSFLSSSITLASAHLTVLDLSDNALGPIGIKGILPLLRSSSCYSLQELYLNNNGLGSEGGRLLALALTECHEKSRSAGTPLTLKKFVCGRNRLENPGAMAMANFFKTVGTLVEVTMPQNGIGHPGISALAEGLACNKNLKVLNMNDNIFTSEGAKAFAQALESVQNLEKLNFGDCLVRTEGAKALAKALAPGHVHLQVVNLGFNEIDKEGGVAIVEAMQNKEELKILELDGNRFGPDGCEALQDMVAMFGKPEVLSIDDDEGEGSDDEDHEGESAVDEDSLYQSPKKDEKIPTSTMVTAAEFLSCPSADALLRMGNNRVNLLLEELGEEVDVDKYLIAFIKVSSVIHPENDMQKSIANECADAILSKLFAKVKQEGQTYLLTNALLVHLGLIKCEDKNFKPPNDLRGPLTVMQHVVRQQYFDPSTKDTFQLFLSKPNKAVESTGKISHVLRSILFQ